MKAKLAFIALLLAPLVPQHANAAKNGAMPSAKLQPLLEPCLNAILAPLQANPKMPRVKVETLRAGFAAQAVTASTPAQQQIYQNAMAVCDAMTSDMDARANAIASAKAAAAAPTLSTGGDIINSAPVRGWDAGADAQAIRGKQKDERAYEDKRAARESAFTDSSAYTSWVKNAPSLRQNVMNLYTRQVELEALYAKSNPPPHGPPPTEAVAPAANTEPAANNPPASAPAPDTGSKPAAAAGSSPNVAFGTFARGNRQLVISQDHSVVDIAPDGTRKKGQWSIGSKGHVHLQFDQNFVTGDFSPDGTTFTTLKGGVFTKAN
jgi:hypothetical protein